LSPEQKNTEQKDIKDLSFEEALSELEIIVRGLEMGETNLDRSIASYERGVALKQYCESKLKEAQGKIEKITVSPSGETATEAFDLKE